MNDKDKKQINLQVANSTYPITITITPDGEEERLMRRAAKQVNIQMDAYRKHFKDQSTERLLGMVAYQLSKENLELKAKNETAPYSEKVKELTELLEGFIRKEEK